MITQPTPADNLQAFLATLDAGKMTPELRVQQATRIIAAVLSELGCGLAPYIKSYADGRQVPGVDIVVGRD